MRSRSHGTTLLSKTPVTPWTMIFDILIARIERYDDSYRLGQKKNTGKDVQVAG
jgi:hypothetical protein